MDSVYASNPNPGASLIVVSAVFGFISVTTTGLRIWARGFQRQLKAEDYFIALSMVLLIVQTAFNGLQVHSGSGQHITTLQPQQIMDTLMWVYLTEIFLFFVVCFTKISICIFVLRIKNTPALRYSLYGLMAGLVVTTLMCEIVIWAQCQPFAAFWDRTLGTCWEPQIYNDIIWVQVAYSMFSDIVCTLLPVIVLWNIKIKLRLKVAICGLMSLGLLATICAAVRASLSGNDESEDLTYSLIFISIWANVEEHLGIIAANLALSRYVYLYFVKGTSNTTANKYYQHGSSYGQISMRRPDKGAASNRGIVSSSHEDSMPLHDRSITKTTDMFVTHETRDSRSPDPYAVM